MNLSQKNNWRVGILGAGRVGSSIALALSGNKVPVLSVVSVTSHSASVLAKKINCKIFSNKIEDLRTCNIIIVSVPDRQLKATAKRVIQIRFTHNSVLLIHTSGMYGATIWNQRTSENKEVKFWTAAMHPLQTFVARMDASPEIFKTYFALDGKNKPVSIVKHIVQILGGKSIMISDNDRATYHASAVIASNFLVALSHASTELLRQIYSQSNGLEKIILPIQQQTLANISKYGAAAALTGPAMRGDKQSIRLHKKAIQKHSKDILKIYTALTSYCVALSEKRQRGKHG